MLAESNIYDKQLITTVRRLGAVEIRFLMLLLLFWTGYYSNKRLDFSGDPDHDADPVVFNGIFTTTD